MAKKDKEDLRPKIYGLIEAWKLFVERKLALEYPVGEGYQLNRLAIGAEQYIYREVEVDGEYKKVDVLSYEDFSKIVKTYLYNISCELIKGKPFSLNGLGIIVAWRHEASNKAIRFEYSRYAKEGITGIDQHEEYCGLVWNRYNHSEHTQLSYNYKFRTLRGNKGTDIRSRFSRANRLNPNLKYNYNYIARNRPHDHSIYNSLPNNS